MTPLQYERWKDFALRMARTCFKTNRRPYWWQIVENVEDFFDCLDPEDIPCIVDWDNSTNYPEGSRYYSRKWRCSCWNCIKPGVEHRKNCPYKCEYGEIYNYAHPYCVGDMCSEAAEQWLPNYWAIPYEDEVSGAFEAADQQWCGPVRCCLRAGLDLASAPSAGVIGFTKGNLEAMYPEGVPDWITEQWEGRYAAIPMEAGVWL